MTHWHLDFTTKVKLVKLNKDLIQLFKVNIGLRNRELIFMSRQYAVNYNSCFLAKNTKIVQDYMGVISSYSNIYVTDEKPPQSLQRHVDYPFSKV